MNTVKKDLLLIVDDLQINRVLMKRIFQDSYDVLEASNGVEALQLLHQNPDIAAMLLDLIMPVMDGFGVLERLNTIPSCRDLPVIVVTACGDADMQIRALKSGAAEVITSPYNPQVILHRVGTILFKARSARDDKAGQHYGPLFSGIVGGAAVVRRADGSLMVLRANDAFFEALGTSRETLSLDEREQRLLLSLLDRCDRTHTMQQITCRRSSCNNIVVNLRAFLMENGTYFLTACPASMEITE